MMSMWLNESNRMAHLLYSIPIGFLLTILCVLGVAIGMEYKDYAYERKWDWLDFLATILGGLIGQAIQIFWIWLII